MFRHTVRWKKIGINKFGEISVQFMNDSLAYYNLNADTVTHILTLNSWDDTTFNSNLHYTLNRSHEYIFEGTFNKDSIRFISTKIDLTNLPLLKDRGKMKWVLW